jgi:hypothetical protein
MTLPETLFAVRWLVRDTLRQARASGILWATLLVIGCCTLFCLSLGVYGDTPPIPGGPGEVPNILPPTEAAKLSPQDRQGIDVPNGYLTVLFGTFRIPLARSRGEAIRFLQALLAGGVADTAGVLLALIWTSGFLPSSLEPSAASVLLAKPVPRWTLLTGKITGALIFVAGQATLFTIATWLALGLRTGVWDAGYFLAIPVLLIHFTCFYCISAFLAVATRSTVACALGTLAAWALCWAVNYRHHELLAAGDAASGAPRILELAYWLLPKPADFGLVLLNALDATMFFDRLPAFQSLEESGAWQPELAVLTSAIVPIGFLAAGVWWLSRTEY